MAESQASWQQMFFWFSRRVLRCLGRVRTNSAKSNDMSCSRVGHTNGQRSQWTARLMRFGSQRRNYPHFKTLFRAAPSRDSRCARDLLEHRSRSIGGIVALGVTVGSQQALHCAHRAAVGGRTP